MKKKIGIIGGLGPASTLDYYNEIIRGYRNKIRKDDYPEIVIDNVNMAELIGALALNQTETVVNMITRSIQNVKAAGATVAAIASNTPHILYDQIAAVSQLPIISIAEGTCQYSMRQNYKKVIVFGTKFTMQSGLYEKAFESYGIEAITPKKEDQQKIHEIIFPNLENGVVVQLDKIRMIQLANQYMDEYHADALVLGCTEIPMMIKKKDVSYPIINTTQIHIKKIIQYLLQDE